MWVGSSGFVVEITGRIKFLLYQVFERLALTRLQTISLAYHHMIRRVRRLRFLDLRKTLARLPDSVFMTAELVRH